VAYTDPFGLCIWDGCIAEFIAASNLAVAAVRVVANAISGRPLTENVAHDASLGLTVSSAAIPGLLAARGAGTAVTVGAAAAEGGGIAATEHGAMRMADQSRLGSEGVAEAVNNATRRLTQRDGASVFVREIEGRFNVVVQGERGVITTFKNLTQKSLDRLARNYGWKE